MPDGNMNEMMQQAQAMQQKLVEAQEQLGQQEVEGTAGGGMVTARVSGTGTELRSLDINPEAVDPNDVGMLSDMVVAAVNDGLRRAKELEQETLGDVTGGLDLPPGLV